MKKQKTTPKLDYHTRQVRRNQAIFAIIAVILILSMALSMVVSIY